MCVCMLPSIVLLYSILIVFLCTTQKVYVAEISPASYRLRGMLSFFSQLLLSVGLLLGYLLGSFSSFKYYDAALVLASLGVVNMLLILPTPETPRWLLVHAWQAFSCSCNLRITKGKA